MRPTAEAFSFACALAERNTVSCAKCGNEFYGDGIGQQTCIWCNANVGKVPQLAFFDVVRQAINGERKTSYKRLLSRRIYLRPGANAVLRTHLDHRDIECAQAGFTVESRAGTFLLNNTNIPNLRVFFGQKKGTRELQLGEEVDIQPGSQLYFEKPFNVFGVTEVFKQPATAFRVCKLIA